MMMNRFMQQQCASMLMALLLLFSIPGTADSAAIDPQADKILRSMSSYLGRLSSFSMKANIENELVTNEGQKLQLSSFAEFAIKRPGKIHVTRKGMFADMEMVYDGKTFTLHSKKPNVYIQRRAPGTVDNAIRIVEFETGLVAPGADLIFADSYPILISGVTRGDYIGTAMFNGVKCHHLAFRENKVDWQLWVKVGKEPLPMKYVITSKWVTAAPQYTVSFHDWNTKAKISAKQFRFSAPKGAKQIEAMPFNVIGEIESEEEGQQ
jgi:hypothetical protein